MNKLFLSLAIVLFSSLLLLNLAGCGGNSSNETENANKPIKLYASTPEEYTQSVLTLLAANEPETFVEFAFPTKEKLRAFIAARVPENRKEQALEQIGKGYAQQKAKVLASFGEIRKAVEKAGGDWKSAKITSTNYDLMTENGITGTSIYVGISAGNKTIEMDLKNCLLINGRWYSMNKLKLEELLNPAIGTIIYDGKPLTGARIRLEATRGAPRVYACDSKSDGTFEIEAVYATKTKKGAPAGNYKVLVGKFGNPADHATGNRDFDAGEVAELELIEQSTKEGGSVLEDAASKTQINAKFNNSSTTPLRVDVATGVNNLTIDLKSDGTGTVK